MGQSSSQIDPAHMAPSPERHVRETPSSTGSRGLRVQLERSAMKSSKDHMKYLAKISPELHSTADFFRQERLAKQKSATGNAVIKQKKVRMAMRVEDFEFDAITPSRPSRPTPTPVVAIARTPSHKSDSMNEVTDEAVGDSIDDGVYDIVNEVANKVIGDSVDEVVDEAINDSVDDTADLIVTRGLTTIQDSQDSPDAIIQNWLDSDNFAPPEETPLAAHALIDTNAVASKKRELAVPLFARHVPHTPTARKRKRANEVVEDIYEFPSCNRSSRPVLGARRATSMTPAKRPRLDIGRATAPPEGTLPINGLAEISKVPKSPTMRKRSLSSIPSRSMVSKGPSPKVQSTTLVDTKQMKQVSAPRKTLKMSLSVKTEIVTGPFSAEERKIADQVFEDVCRAQNISGNKLRSLIQIWSAEGAAPFRDALIAALPRRKLRSLMDFSRRNFAVSIEEEDIKTSGPVQRVVSQSKGKRRSSIAKAQPETDAAIVPCENVGVQHTDLPIKKAWVVVKRVPQPESAIVPQGAQQPTPNSSEALFEIAPVGTQTAAPTSFATAEEVLANPRPTLGVVSYMPPYRSRYDRPEEWCEEGEAARAKAHAHLNIFDMGDYYDMLDDLSDVLETHWWLIPTFVDKTKRSSPIGRQFWHDFIEIPTRTRFKTIRDQHVLAKLRYMTYSVATRKFDCVKAAPEIFDNPKTEARRKIEVCLDWIKKVEGERYPRDLARMWRAELADCTREEAAWITWSEERERTCLWDNDWCPEHIRVRGKKAWKQAVTRLQKEHRRANPGAYSKEMSTSGGTATV